MSEKFQMYESKEMGLSKVGNELKAYKKGYTSQEYTPWLYRHFGDEEKKRLLDLPPCTFGIPLIDYFNREDVRSLLHIPTTVQAWDMCTSAITYHSDYKKGSQYVYEALKGKYRMLFYSGDTDGAVPTFGSLQWIQELNWKVNEAWRPYLVDG